MGKNKSCDATAREMIIKLRDHNWLYQKIVDHLHCSKTIVYQVVKHFNTHQATSNVVRKPIARKTSPREDLRIVHLVKQDPFKGSVEIENEILVPLSKNDSADNMLSCNETVSECTESESSEQYFECNETPSLLDKIEPLNTIENFQQTLKFIEATVPENMKPPRPPKPQTDPPKPNLSTVSFIKENMINTKATVSNDNIIIASTSNDSIANARKDSLSHSLPPSRKISLEHKIDMEDTEPPLILDSNSPSGSIKTITEVIPAALQAKLDSASASHETSQGNSQNSPSDAPTEVQVKQDDIKASPSEISPPLSEIQHDLDSIKKLSPDQPKEQKRSQNLSTDFDLSEQLQRILGTGREDKKTDQKEVKIVEEPMTMPTVKISSPDSQKTRLGVIDMVNPKQLHTSVQSVEQHVAFGFKATLIRVLANLCWKHQVNKKQVRELGVIPILLDCCNIDARNPLIMQWVIFAVRNLCENSPENQEVISKLTLRGPVDNELLKEMGLTLNTDAQNNTIKIMPLKVQ